MSCVSATHWRESLLQKPIFIPVDNDPAVENMGHWAAELHFIKGVPYLFTTLSSSTPGHCYVRSCILRCNGDPAVPENWEQPRLCLKPNGAILTEGGISLDMTYFCVNGVHYIMWSDRKVPNDRLDFTQAAPADIYIATVDPDAPWQLTTEPQCVLRPIYGWDRYETEVRRGSLPSPPRRRSLYYGFRFQHRHGRSV